MPFKDLTNKKFGRLTVLKNTERHPKNRQMRWVCRCDCGNIKITNSGYLQQGSVKSCGCLLKETAKTVSNDYCRTHGMNGTRFYGIFHGIHTRCFNKKYNRYKNYGGRGIKVCDRWLKFENFYDDMYRSYLEHVKLFGIKETTIDRINNDGNYEPGNCRWATPKEQSNNRRIINK